jgi:hypothetical protein
MVDEEIATLANGSKIRVNVASPVEVRFENRRTTVDAVVVPQAKHMCFWEQFRWKGWMLFSMPKRKP